jgi:hypothetical protein
MRISTSYNSSKTYNGIWLQVRWGIQRYLVWIKNLKIHKEKNDRKATQPHLLVAKVSGNGPFAAAGWEFRERKLGKSTKDY